MDEEITFEETYKMIVEYGERAKQLYINKMTDDDHNVSGKLLSTITTDVKYSNYAFTVSLNLQEYWKYVEYGVGLAGDLHRQQKSPPPYRAILDWIMIKPVQRHPDKDGNLPTEQKLAWMIRRSIFKNGIAGGHQLAETIEELNAQYLPKIQDAIERDFDIYAIKLFKGWESRFKL